MTLRSPTSRAAASARAALQAMVSTIALPALLGQLRAFAGAG